MNLSTFHVGYDSLRNRTLSVIYREYYLFEANKSLFSFEICLGGQENVFSLIISM
jgi:hypothetical protein